MSARRSVGTSLDSVLPGDGQDRAQETLADRKAEASKRHAARIAARRARTQGDVSRGGGGGSSLSSSDGGSDLGSRRRRSRSLERAEVRNPLESDDSVFEGLSASTEYSGPDAARVVSTSPDNMPKRPGLMKRASMRIGQATENDDGTLRYRRLFHRLDTSMLGCLDREQIEQGITEMGFDPLLPKIDLALTSKVAEAEEAGLGGIRVLDFIALMKTIKSTALGDERSVSGGLYRMLNRRDSSRGGGMPAVREEPGADGSMARSDSIDEGGEPRPRQNVTNLGRLCVRLVRTRNLRQIDLGRRELTRLKRKHTKKRSRSLSPFTRRKEFKPKSTWGSDTKGGVGDGGGGGGSGVRRRGGGGGGSGGGYEWTDGSAVPTTYDKYEVSLTLHGLMMGDNDHDASSKITQTVFSETFHEDKMESPPEVLIGKQIVFPDVRGQGAMAGASLQLQFSLRATTDGDEPPPPPSSPRADPVAMATPVGDVPGNHSRPDGVAAAPAIAAAIGTSAVSLGVKTRFVGWCHVPLTRTGRRAGMRAQAKEREEEQQEQLEAQRAEQRRQLKAKSRLYTSGSSHDDVTIRSRDSVSYDSVTSDATSAGHDSDNDGDDEGDGARAKNMASPWDVLAWYPIQDSSGNKCGEAYIGVRVEHNDISSLSLMELDPIERTLFSMYDEDEDGLLAPCEFLALVADLQQVHGDISTLAGRMSNPGCLGFFIGLPEIDLLGYISYNHTLTFVFRGMQPGMHWTERAGGISMNMKGRFMIIALSLCYSLMVNCFVEINTEDIFKGRASLKVLTKTLLDVIGVTLFQQALFFANLRCIAQGFRVLFSFLIVMLTIVGPAFYLSSQTSKREFAVVSETFLPIWALARVTEVFQLGTLWGLKVSYGSSQGCDCF